MGKVDGNEFVVARGKGARVWDVDGREYLDGTAGLWFVNVGHGRSEIAQAAAAQMERLAAHHCFGDHANEPALALAERLSGVAPVDDGVVFFTNDGSESVDSAGKIARRYWSLLGQPEKQIIVSRRHAYHGMNAYGTSLAGIPANMEGFGRLIEGTATSAWDDPADLGAHPRRARGPRRRLHRRARDRRRRRHPAAGRLLAGGRPHLPRARRPVRLGRGHLRLRPARRVVRRQALRRAARPHHLRQGHHVRLRAARRGGRLAPGVGALLGRRRPAVPPRLHVHRPRRRLCHRPGGARHLRARGPVRARAPARAVPARPDGDARRPAGRGRGAQRGPLRRGRVHRRGARRDPRPGRRGRRRVPQPRRHHPRPARRGAAALAGVRVDGGRAGRDGRGPARCGARGRGVRA